MSLSDRIRPDVEAAPWVVDEVKKLEAERDEARAALCTVAERQREACADAAQELLSNYVTAERVADAVRATPLVTEVDK